MFKVKLALREQIEDSSFWDCEIHFNDYIIQRRVELSKFTGVNGIALDVLKMLNENKLKLDKLYSVKDIKGIRTEYPSYCQIDCPTYIKIRFKK